MFVLLDSASQVRGARELAFSILPLASLESVSSESASSKTAFSKSAFSISMVRGSLFGDHHERKFTSCDQAPPMREPRMRAALVRTAI